MPEYTTYRDSNGITWRILTTQTKMFATQDESSGVKYDPDPPDMGPVPRLETSSDATIAEVTEADRRAFQNLRELIDDYGSKHQRAVILKVSASRGGGWVWLVIGGLILLGGGRKRRR